MKTEHLTQELLDSLQSNERLRERLRALGEEDLFAELVEPPEAPFIPSEAALQAALCVTYSPDQILGSTEQVAAVVKASSVQICNGLSRLKLDDGFRGKVLLEARQRGILEMALDLSRTQDDELLDQSVPDPSELESAWLRQWLRRERVDLERYPHLQIGAAYRALLALGESASLLEGQPALRDVQRQMQWLELIEPLRLMIGAPPRQQGKAQAADRFAGRADELRTLRAFVDELASQSLMESASRVLSRVRRSFSGKPRMMMLSARGGLGKSTLISKFAYDHAVLGRGMPFAYLDFDSAVLQPRNPLLLLAEVARQVALFYPQALELESFVASVRQKVLETAREGGELLYSRELFERFRELLQRLVADHSARSFLLVLDTLELVQSDATALEMVQHFLDSLIEEDFPELVVVASGRAQVPELYEGVEGNEKDRWSVREMELAPLSAGDAGLMVQLLGNSLLPDQWQAQWSKQMLGKSLDSASREPLSLRIAVEAVRDAEPASREALVEEIAAMGEGCDARNVDFVGRLYQKRILEHIADPYVRKLAWPGLVARSISEKLAREVLSPECGLTAEQAGAAFQRLRREVWIVTPEGDELRHRSDLRARTLPLMRRHDEVLFKKICGLMAAYHLDKRPLTVDERAQAAYYRLLGDDGEATRMLEEEGGGVLQQLLVQRKDDFAAGSLVTQEIKVRQASRLLPYQDFRKLSPPLAWRHAEKVGQVLKRLGDTRTDPRILVLSRSITSVRPNQISAAQQTILIKTGRWNELAQLSFVEPENLFDLRAAAFMANFLCSTSVPSNWTFGALNFLAASNKTNWDWQTLTYMLFPALHCSPDLYHRIDHQLAETLPRYGALRKSWLPVLRIALAFGSQSLAVALDIYIKHQYTPRSREAIFTGAELNILSRHKALAGYLMKGEQYSFESIFKRAPESLDSQISAFKVLGEAADSIQQGGAESIQTRRGIRSFALAGAAGLASPAGYLLELASESLIGLRKSRTKHKTIERHIDLIQICRKAEWDNELLPLLEGALREIESPTTCDNIRLIKLVAENWNPQMDDYRLQLLT